MTGIELIAHERQRQIEQEGWTAEHDDQYKNDELFRAAVCYYTGAAGDPTPDAWPWHPKWWKPKDRIQNLIRAGALFQAAEDQCKSREDVERFSYLHIMVINAATEIDMLQRQTDDSFGTTRPDPPTIGFYEFVAEPPKENPNGS